MSTKPGQHLRPNAQVLSPHKHAGRSCSFNPVVSFGFCSAESFLGHLPFNATCLLAPPGGIHLASKAWITQLAHWHLLVGTQGSRALVTISNHQPVQCSSTCSGLYSSAKESSPSEMHLIAAHHISQHRQQHSNGLWTLATSFAFVTKGRQLIFKHKSLCKAPLGSDARTRLCCHVQGGDIVVPLS